MQMQDLLNKKIIIQDLIIKFIDDDQIEENFQNLINVIENQKITKDKYELKYFLYLISHISNNHYRSSFFFNKIEKILKYFKKTITQYFTNNEIFNIFQKNKRILLFLFEEQILFMDKTTVNCINKNESYCQYFLPEICKCTNCTKNDEKMQKIPDNFNVERERGENNNYLCYLIRNDFIDDFISYTDKSTIQLTSNVKFSIYETHNFLIKNKPTLIEYAAFYGSINILRYLHFNGAKLKPSLWIYAIHSNNLNLILFLEENFALTDDNYIEKCLIESIKCHHNEITKYLLENIMKRKDYHLIYEKSIKYYNFAFFPTNFDEDYLINFLCKYDHYIILENILDLQKINIPKYLEFAKKINSRDITELLISFSNDKNDLNDPELIPFLFWEKCIDGKIRLTKEASNKISSSNNPFLALNFGQPRKGKSTIASHLASGPLVNPLNTIFKTAGSSTSCTHLIHAVGPIKCSKIASLFNIDVDEEYNENMNRDIFIIDSEGLNSYEGETIWLKQAIIAMLPICTVSIYVSKSINKIELDQFIKYLTLVRVVGGKEIHHGLAYINNIEIFDGLNVIDQMIAQNERTTKWFIDEFNKTSINIDDSHFKCISIVSFREHRKEYFKSIAEIAKFIVNLCLNEGTVLSGKMIANILEEMVDKTSELSDLTDLNNSFDVLFYQILEKSMNHSIEEQIPQMQEVISKKLVAMPLQYLKLLDINEYMKGIAKSEFFNEIISCAVDKTFSDLPQSFPVVYETCQTNAINIIREIVECERSELISKGALEVYNLGSGFSIFEGTYKKKVFDLHFTSKPVEKKINDDEFLVCRIPDNAYVEVIPFDLQSNTTRNHSSFDEYISQIDLSFRDNGKIGLKSSKLSFSKISNLAKNLFGYSYSRNAPENNISYFLSVNLLAKICLNEETLSDQCFVQPLKNKLTELEEILYVNDIKSPEVKKIISEIYSNYGETIALGFFYGNYEIDIDYNENQSIESKGQGSTNSKNDSSCGFGFRSLRIGENNSNETNNENSSMSQIVSSLQDNTKILCGNPENPSIFMYDIALNFSQNTSVKSSFAPLFKYVKSKSVAEALEYWAGRWNAKPETYSEYCELNDIEFIPINTQFSLYYNNRPYNVEINTDGEIIIPNSKIEYTGTHNECFDVVLDPETMTISGFKKDIFVDKWQRKHHIESTDRGFSYRELYTKLNHFWSFDQEITKAFFTGDGLNYLEIIDANPHSFKVKYDHYPDGGGWKWRVVYHANLQQKLKVTPS